MHWAACKYTVHLLILFSESYSLATKPFSLILSDNEEYDWLSDWLALSSCSMSCCRANILQILWDTENWPLHPLLDLAHYVLEEIFTCWLAKLVDGNKLKVTNLASRLSACGHASLDYSSASCILGSCDGRVTFCTTYVFVFILLCVRGHGDRQHINS